MKIEEFIRYLFYAIEIQEYGTCRSQKIDSQLCKPDLHEVYGLKKIVENHYAHNKILRYFPQNDISKYF